MTLLIDGNSIAARAFFATHYNTDVFDERIFSNAFVKSLLHTLRSINGEDIIFCVDSKSWRKKIFPEYKENRNALKNSVPYREYINCFEDICADMKEMLPMEVLRKEPYEADDLIAYFVRAMSAADLLIVSADKDLRQYYNPPKVQIFNQAENRIEKIADVKEFLQILICTGDASDNIPSLVPKKPDGKAKFRFGEKTVPEYISWTGPCGLSAKFWKKLTEAEQDIFLDEYDRNRRLIDLDMSPIHGDFIPFPIAKKYDSFKVEKFFRRYMNSMYETQGEYIQELFSTYGGQNENY